jgi:hypothetical protein
LAYTLKPAGAKGGVTKVEVVIDGHTVAYADKNDVERETMARNEKQFNEAAGSPFTIFPLSEVGVTATKFKTARLPDGTRLKMPADAFLETETILDLLQRPKPGAKPAKISSRISLDDFTSAIKAWKEPTSTSPSGPHLGHCKLLVKVLEDTHANPDSRQAAGEILQLMVDIMDLASDRGFILDRWTAAVNVMIYKKPGVYLLNRLRVMHLFEADYNFIIGTIFGRRATCSGVDNYSRHTSQWAQPGRQCSDVVVICELRLAVSKLAKAPMAGFYDRIVMNLVAAIFDRMGVPHGPQRLQEQTLLKVIHFLKTGFGASVASHTSDAISRICGVGQGSKAGPVTWVGISSLLFEAQDLLGIGLSLTNPTRSISHKRHSDGFVDNTTGYLGRLIQWLRNKPSIATVFQELQNDTQIWERLLWTTGGLLELEKCRFYIVHWKFNANGIGSMMSKAEMRTPTMLLTEGDTGSLQKVDQLHLDESFKTLGIHKTISGHQGKQITEMKTKSDACARGILSVNVTNFEAWTGLFTIWCGQMNYPLAAASIPRPACEKIQSKAISASLSKCGFNQKTNRAIVHGTPWFGGLGWRHMYFEQGIQHILTIVKHLRTPPPFQSLLQNALDWHQVTAGVSFSPLHPPSVPIKYIKCPWIDVTCAMLLHCSAQLTIPGITLPKPKRVHDECIMEGLIPLNLPVATLERINACRLWLRVETLSDVSTLHGDRIDRIAWLGRARMPCNDSEWSGQCGPSSARPCPTPIAPTTDGMCWPPSLDDSLSDSAPGSPTAPLKPLLGGATVLLSNTALSRCTTGTAHTTSANDSQRPPDSNSAWRRTPSQQSLSSYAPKTSQQTQFRPSRPTIDAISALTASTLPTYSQLPHSLLPHSPFQDHLDTLPEWQHNLFAGLHLTTGHDSLGQHLLNGDRLFFCSDGGAKTMLDPSDG